MDWRETWANYRPNPRPREKPKDHWLFLDQVLVLRSSFKSQCALAGPGMKWMHGGPYLSRCKSRN